MSDRPWTPGPWHIVPYGDGNQLVICIDEAGDWRIAFMATAGSTGNSAEIEANARMIAAAPEMYEALTAAADYIDNPSDDMPSATVVVRAARVALAKARGEE